MKQYNLIAGVDDIVYILDQNAIARCKVVKILIVVDKVVYTLRDASVASSYRTDRNMDKVFNSKEDLLASL